MLPDMMIVVLLQVRSSYIHLVARGKRREKGKSRNTRYSTIPKCAKIGYVRTYFVKKGA